MLVLYVTFRIQHEVILLLSLLSWQSERHHLALEKLSIMEVFSKSFGDSFLFLYVIQPKCVVSSMVGLKNLKPGNQDQ